MANRIIRPNDMVRIYKNMVGGIGFYTASGVEKHWDSNREYFDMIFSEAEYFVSNNHNKFLNNKLIIKDENVRNVLNLPPLEEYLDRKKIHEILETKDSNKIEDMIATSTDNELELITDEVVFSGTKDRNTLQLVEEYTGIEDMQEVAEENIVAEKETVNDGDKPKRRSKVVK